MLSLGDSLDHLACSAMGFRDWPPREELSTFYEAARQVANGDPISWRMAKELQEATATHQTVIVTTGEYEEGLFAHGESDGPVGIAVLSRTLERLGCKVVVVSDPRLFGVHRAVIDGFLGQPIEYVSFPGGKGFDYRTLAASILKRFNPAALIACEKLGRNAAGEYHDASGRNCSADENRVDYLFDLAYEQGILTLAFGDHGNEIGFGSIKKAARAISPFGHTCNCNCKQGIIAVTKTSYLLPAAVSNWGAIALSNMLAALNGRQDLVHTAGRQRWLQELLLDNAVIDGVLLSVSRSVDSIEGDVDLALIKVMEAATLRSLTNRAVYLKFKGRK